jgi:hypothetical protein
VLKHTISQLASFYVNTNYRIVTSTDYEIICSAFLNKYLMLNECLREYIAENKATNATLQSTPIVSKIFY